MPLILGTNSIKDTGYDVANSLRFNSGSADSLQITPSSAGSLLKWTFSTWVKRSKLSGGQQLLSAGPRSGGTVEDQLYILDGGEINWYDGTSATHVRRSSNLFRDPSAWYHFVFVWDTANGTANNRARIYVNGSEITYGTQTTISQNANSKINGTGQHRIGAIGTVSGEEFNGYICETVFVNNQALAPTDFGEFDSDSPTIWKPKDVSGLTFGTNGFYLEFKQSGTSQNSSGLGADTSGQDNHFAVNNLTAIDQSTDTCTNNFATLNPLDVYASKTGTLSEGNLKLTVTTSNLHTAVATIAPSSGKWYWEVELDSTDGSNPSNLGITDLSRDDKSNMPSKNAWGYGYNASTGDKQNGGTNSSYGDSYTSGDILGCAMDLDNGAVYFSKNGTFQASGDPTSGSSKTNAAFTWTPDSSMNWCPYVADNTSGVAFTWLVNYGSPSFSISSGNTDGNGFGNFEYAVPSGYFSLCTKNLAESG